MYNLTLLLNYSSVVTSGRLTGFMPDKNQAFCNILRAGSQSICKPLLLLLNVQTVALLESVALNSTGGETGGGRGEGETREILPYAQKR